MLRLASALVAALLAWPAAAQDAAPQLLLPPEPGSPSAMLLLPPGWSTGDAAVVMIVHRGATTHHALSAALLAEGAAVVEQPVPPDLPALALVPDLLAIATALRLEAGAGPLVALGWAEGGTAALLAALPKIAKAETGRDGPRLAVAARLGPAAAFATGDAPAAREAWPARVELLCALLAAAAAAPADACRDGLLPQGTLAAR